VASIAAGNGLPADKCDPPLTYVGVAPEADIIVVRYVFTDSRIRDALQYIFAKAETRPCVINMSWGDNRGPHDGTHPLEQDIDRVVVDAAGNPIPGRVLVKSAGNEGYMRRHARKPIAANGAVTFTFKLAATPAYPADANGDTLDIWFDSAATLTLSIERPKLETKATPLDGSQTTIGGSRVTVSSATIQLNGQNHFSIDIDSGPMNLGEWKLHFTETAGAPATIEIWAARDNEDVYPRFVGADAVRENTISTPGNARNVIAVGNYNPDRDGDFQIADSSSWGAPIDWLPAGQRLKPDIAAPGEKIMAAKSGTARHAPPCCKCCEHYLHMDLDGTSMAAPHVTGAIALMLEKNPTLTFEQVRSILQLTADIADVPNSQMPPVLPPDRGGETRGALQIHQNHIWGAGRINVKRAVDLVAAPGGGGGGGGTITWEDAPARPALLRNWRTPTFPEALGEHPALQLMAALVSTHVDEVLRLINANKRVATVWRRGGGPLLIRQILRRPDLSDGIPKEVETYSIAGLLERLMQQLLRFGGDKLRGDVARWREFVLAAPGADLDALDARLAAFLE
jgi:subtilisin family serine protease